MNRLIAVVAGVLVMVGGVFDAREQGPVGPGEGVRIVSRSELQAVPGAPAAEAERLLAQRRLAAPPDGVVRRTICLKGTAVRIEYPTSPDGTVVIRPAGTKVVYRLNTRERTYTVSPLSASPLADMLDVDHTPTRGVETIASLRADETRFSARLLTPGVIPGAPRPTSNPYDGYTLPDSSSYSPPVRSATDRSGEPVPFATGRVWLATLPGGMDTRALSRMVDGWMELEPFLKGRYPMKQRTDDGVDAVFVAFGSMKSPPLRVDGEQTRGVHPSLRFLSAFHLRGVSLARGQGGRRWRRQPGDRRRSHRAAPRGSRHHDD
jgi:hypothetical protein